MRIALAQLTSGPDPQHNLGLVTDWSGRAADAGADMVVFPEATMSWFAVNPSRAAEDPDGPWAAAVSARAAELDLTIAVGMFTRDGDRVRNTLLVTDGHRTHRYHKIHLFDAFGHRESDTVAPGHAGVLVDLGLRTGLAVCYDLRFPELFKRYAAAGAELVLLPASWAAGPDKVEMWRTLAVARALDTTCWVVACGQADPGAAGVEVPSGRTGAPTGVGHSVVVDPLGRVVAEAGDGPQLLVVDLDHEAVGQARAALPVLANSVLPTAELPLEGDVSAGR